MIRRFSLYGFLKNQQYYDPFLILAFREKGLSFLSIGLLIAFREIMINVFEVPSGAVADTWGRRRSMIFSFCAYIVSFVLFGAAEGVTLLYAAMLFFAMGDAFRTGTHKAMIFTWLRLQGRENERTRVYGFTRSWSKYGSAVSVLMSAALVLATGRYSLVFYACIIPYAAGIINFLGYPRELEGDCGGLSVARVAVHLKETLFESVRNKNVRRLILESMGFEGVFISAKDYLQPVLAAAAVPAAALLLTAAGLDDSQKAALMVGPVYFVLYLLSAFASRRSHRLVERAGGEDRAAAVMWVAVMVIFALMLPSMWFGIHALIILTFVALHVMQNLWRPVLISRFDTYSTESQGATVLSIENQAKSISAMLLAPLMGWAVDSVQAGGMQSAYWPVAAIGLAVSLMFAAQVLLRKERRKP